MTCFKDLSSGPQNSCESLAAAVGVYKLSAAWEWPGVSTQEDPGDLVASQSI